MRVGVGVFTGGRVLVGAAVGEGVSVVSSQIVSGPANRRFQSELPAGYRSVPPPHNRGLCLRIKCELLSNGPGSLLEGLKAGQDRVDGFGDFIKRNAGFDLYEVTIAAVSCRDQAVAIRATRSIAEQQRLERAQ